MQRRLLLDIVIGQRASILQLLPCKDKPLLIRRNPLLILDLRLDILNRVRWLHIQRNRLARKRLDEYLHL